MSHLRLIKIIPDIESKNQSLSSTNKACVEDFIKLRGIQLTDSGKLRKLKKNFNEIATLINCHCHNGVLFSKQKQFELIHNLYLVGKEINEIEQQSTPAKKSLALSP
jgi:hypothetical protein